MADTAYDIGVDDNFDLAILFENREPRTLSLCFDMFLALLARRLCAYRADRTTAPAGSVIARLCACAWAPVVDTRTAPVATLEVEDVFFETHFRYWIVVFGICIPMLESAGFLQVSGYFSESGIWVASRVLCKIA